jgi:hypothetical protein
MKVYKGVTPLWERQQQKKSLYTKWFHSILNEFTGLSKQGLARK